MDIETNALTGPLTERLAVTRRSLAAAGVMALLAGSLAFSAPAFAQEEDDEAEAGTTGTTVQVGATDEEAATDGATVENTGGTVETAAAPAETEGATAETAAAPAAPAAPQTAAAPATGAATTTTALPNTGVGEETAASLPLIALATAGAIAAGAVAVRHSRPAPRRA